MSHKKRTPFLIPATIVFSTVAFCLYINRDPGSSESPVADAIAKLDMATQNSPIVRSATQKDLGVQADQELEAQHPVIQEAQIATRISDEKPVGAIRPTFVTNGDNPEKDQLAVSGNKDQFGWQKNAFFGQGSPSTRVASLPTESSSRENVIVENNSEFETGNNDFELDLNSPGTTATAPTKKSAPISIFESMNSDNDSFNELELAPEVENQINWAIQRTVDPPTSLDFNQPQANRLPTRNAIPTVNSPQIPDSVLQKAVHHIEYGKSLARRGSSFSARQEFLAGLRLMAQAADSRTGQPLHTDALNKAITAINEAEDFYAVDSESQMTNSVANAIATHDTKAFPAEIAESMTPIEAMQRYFAYAQLKLNEAGGQNVVSSEAMFCLGKLHAMLSKQPTADPLNIAKAIVYHRSALACDSNHFRSANELGALLVKTGQLEDAKVLFQDSLRIRKMAVTWKNLATVHQRLGEQKMAQLASNEYQIAMQQPVNTAMPDNIQWMTPSDFNAKAPVEIHKTVAQKPNAPVSDQPATKQRPSLTEMFKLF